MAENFKERKAKNNFTRRQAYHRTEMPRVLIVTEGAVTEVEYFTDMCRSLGLSPITVHPAEGIGLIGKECGSAPISVFKYAHEAFLKKDPKEKGIAQQYYWDEVYCVFDRDTHTTYHETLEKIQLAQRKNKKRVLRAITSHRCFELWFLLHFKDTAKDFANSTAIGNELKKIQHNRTLIFDKYGHGSKGIFHLIKDKLATAKTNARKLNGSHPSVADYPHTFVVDLVTRIEEIAKKRQNLGLRE